MLIYYLLLFIPMISKNISVKYEGLASKTKKINKTVIFFFLLFLILSCRDLSVGTDLQNSYQDMFTIFTRMGWDNVFSTDIETGYVLLNKTVGYFGDFRILLIIIAAFAMFMLYRLYNKDDEFQLIRIVLFCNIGIFSFLFSGLRQVIAISIGIIAYDFVKKKKVVPFLCSVFIAMLFHQSASILFLLYPVYNFRFRKKYLYVIIPVIILVFVIRNNLFLFMIQFLGQKYIDTYSEITATGAFSMLVLYIIFMVYSFIIPAEEKIDIETRGLRNILVFIVVLQVFASINTIAMRMNYYYIIFIPLLIPEIIKCSKKKYSQITLLSKYVIYVFFSFYFIYQGYYGNDVLNIFPYIPFWKGNT